MAKYNIYGHVLYSEIEYEKLMNMTERIFINSLMNGIPDISSWVKEIWDNIDHEYMIKTLEEIEKDIINSDIGMYMKYKNTAIDIEEMIQATNGIENLYEINSIDKFREIERAYGQRVASRYKKKHDFMNEEIDPLEYLTNQIKNFSKIEQSVPYYSNGLVVRHVTPSTYLSMLYNVNLTRTGWNQTFKDAEYFENDLLLLETHRNSCDKCGPMQRKSIFKEW